MSRYRVIATQVDIIATYGDECAFELALARGGKWPAANDETEVGTWLYGAEFETEWDIAEAEGAAYVPADAEELRKHLEAGRIEAI